MPTSLQMPNSKGFITGLFLVSLIAVSNSSEAMTKKEFCEELYWMAEMTMLDRQNGMSMPDTREDLHKATDELNEIAPIKKAFKKMADLYLMEAYDQPVYPAPEAKELARKSFAEKQFSFCLRRQIEKES